MTSRHSDHPLPLTTLLQSFFVIPFWDAQSLVKLARGGNSEVRRQLTGFGAALLIALTGWWALRWLFPGGCCRISTVLSPGTSVRALIWPRLLPSFGMLVVIALSGLIATGLLTGLSTISRRLEASSLVGKMLNMIRRTAMSLLASPPGHLSLLAVLLAGIRFGLLPVPAGRSAAGLIIPGFIVALLPALIAANRVEHTTFPNPSGHPKMSILLAGATFYRQASWLIGGLVVTEAVFGVDGVGKLLAEALRAGDKPIILPVLLLFMAATAFCRLHVISLELSIASAPDELAKSVADDTVSWFRWIILAIILIAPLAFALSGSSRPVPDPSAVYMAPSVHYPWGTDRLGLDIMALARAGIRHGWLIALIGGLVSTGLGGLWASGIRWLRDTDHPALADGLRTPAESLILLAPAPLTLWLLLRSYGPDLPIAALGILAGMVLIPRTAWGLTNRMHATLRLVDLLKQAGVFLAAGGFAALQAHLLVALIVGPGDPGPITPGGLVASYQDMIAGANLLNGGPYLRLALALALPGLVLAWGWYLLAQALTDPQNSDVPADLLR